MDNLLYISITNIISLISLIGIVVLIVIFLIKKKIGLLSVILFLLFLVGTYLYIPMKLATYGYIYQKPEVLKKTSKISINPYEKRLCYKYIAEIYADDIFYQGIKDGSKAIEYMERALKGQYSKYKEETENLAYWYSIKGDKEKTLELVDKFDNKELYLLNIYIMEDDYKKALDALSSNNKGVENFLKADLYKKLGNLEASKEAKKIAQERYDSVLGNIKIRARRLEFKETVEKYKSTEAYKDWILAKRREYGFN